ncbi:ABC transporter ATP-binding protein [Anthropogastromicrobium sp.]|uniref:ABC transporter ATP-binding protein n=1 Tax=Anthropogastromicrobium sp. TaxID=2981649 RepID=UPI00307A33B3
MKRLFGYMGPYKKDMILGALFVMIETGFELFIPIMISNLIDIGVANHDVNYIYVKGVQMALLALGALVTGLLYAHFSAKASYGWGAEIRKAEYARVQQYAFSNLDHFVTSSLITRMTTDVNVLQNMIISGFRPITRGPSLLIMGIGLSFYMNPKLAFVFVVCTPILAIILFLIVRKVAPMYTRLQSIMDRLNQVVQENLTAIRAVKAFVRDEYEEDKFEEVNRDMAKSSETTFHYAVLNLPAFQGIMYTTIVMILWFGGNMILKSELAVGNLTGFLSYVMQVINSLMMLANVFLLLTRSLASAHRIAEILDENIVLTSPENGEKKVKDGSIDFENVSFKYREDAREYALENVNLHIPAGQTIGVIGTTGSAKTTLVQLIPRLYDATTGVVRVGGVNVHDYDLSVLRDSVNITLQKNVLFSGTVRENLKWGNPFADDETIWKACRAACADEFLSRMPDGLDTMLEQGGNNLSGGQKQRLCIARALLGNAKILIFDDSTSAVDTATEKKIRKALADYKDVTKIIIAQRITSVMNTDQIVILDDGKVHRVGTHKELLANDPIYQEIYASQMKGGNDDGSEE